MERLFSPCTRLHEILESQGALEEDRDHDPDPLHELNLDVSTEDFLSAESAFTYADLYAMLGSEYTDTVAWLTSYAAVVRGGGRAMHFWNRVDKSCLFRFNADGQEISLWARSTEHLLEICDVLLRLLAVSVVQSVIEDNWTPDLVITAPTLEYMMEQCQSLKVLSLVDLKMDENHCRVLGAYSRPALEISLVGCAISDAVAITLAEVLGRNQGPTKLDRCKIDNFVLANGLRGNSRLKSLKLRLSTNVEVSNREVFAIADALQQNMGLVVFNLTCNGFRVTYETWGAVCDSLKAHPTLEVLDLRAAFTDPTTALAALKSRIQALVDMMKVNMSIHTIYLHYRLSHHELFRESVIPYLETNRFRPRLLAIQKTRPIPYRAKVLGRALLSARTNTNRLWMLLSGNAEVAFPSSTTTIAAAANLPTPTTADATSTANVAAGAASAMASFATTATGSVPTAVVATTAATCAVPPSTTSVSDALAFAPTAAAAAAAAAASAATPPAGQKRKSRH
jgi:hypothetical protein